MTEKLTTAFRKAVSGDRIRYSDGNFDLDLSYITPRIIAMSFPAEGLESTWRNSITKVLEMLQSKHGSDFMVWNLTERAYRYEKFNDQVLHFAFADHHPPTMDSFFAILHSIDSWLKANDNNVAVIHCLGGKGRTGTIISAFLYYNGDFDDVDEARREFAKNRSSKEKGVTQPSQLRYIRQVSQVLRNKNILTTSPTVKISGIRMEPFPKGLSFILEICQYKDGIEYDDSTLFSYDLKKNYPDNICIVDTDVHVNGDIIIRLLESNGKETIFHIVFHTTFLDLNHYKIDFPRNEIDLIFTGKDKRFSEDFHLSLNYVPPMKNTPGQKNAIWDIMRVRYHHERRKRLGQTLNETQSRRITLLEDQLLTTSKKLRECYTSKMNLRDSQSRISTPPSPSSPPQPNYLINNQIIIPKKAHSTKDSSNGIHNPFASIKKFRKKESKSWDPFNPPVPAIIPSHLAIVKEGELDVFFSRSKKWKTKWFQIEKGYLVRYKSKDGPERERINLADASFQEYQPDKIPFCFQLTTEDGNKLIMKAASEFEMQEWLNSILRSKLDPLKDEEPTVVPTLDQAMPANSKTQNIGRSDSFNLYYMKESTKEEFQKLEKEWELLAKKQNEAVINGEHEKAKLYETQANELHEKIVHVRKNMEQYKKQEKEKEDELDAILNNLELEIIQT